MFGEEHYKLRLVRLEPSELWINQSRNEDELTFVFLKGGIGKYVFPNATQRLVAGSTLVFSGYASGKLYADEKQDCVFASFSLLFEHLFPLFSSNEISLLHKVVANFKAARIYSPSSAVAMGCQPLLEIAHTQSGLEQRSQLLRIVAAILSEEFKNVRSHRSGLDWAEDHMIQVFEKLSSVELLNLSVDELAGKFSCSRRHLNRLFHQHFGLSVTALRMEMRLLKAVSLLRNQKEKIINVAEQCGFNHLGLFNTCFKRRYGTSPGQWRKSALGAESPSAWKSEVKQICPLHANGLCPWGGQLGASGQPAKAQISGRAAEIAGGFGASGRQASKGRISSAASVRSDASRAQPGSAL